MQKKIKIIIISISLLLFAASLTQCAFEIKGSGYNDGCWGSLMALLTGWMYPAGAGISWFANPLLVLACIFIFKKEKLSVILSFFACLFALSFLSFQEVMSDEAGHYSNIVSIGLGYWLWLSACVVCSIGSVIILFISRQKK